MENRIMFLRTKSGSPEGCLAITINQSTKLVEYQYSVINASKDVFDRKTARELAVGRLFENPITVRLRDSFTMYNISAAVMKNLSRRKAAPSRAVKAAKLWLKQNEA